MRRISPELSFVLGGQIKPSYTGQFDRVFQIEKGPSFSREPPLILSWYLLCYSCQPYIASETLFFTKKSSRREISS